MNLDQIATKCFILALFIRDDDQRLLLGDGYYDFNQKLQHFQANTIANDIVEIQGDNGQLLAGQVMRSGAQKFEGYIGDATTSRQIIEQKRSDFMAFFRIKHFYKVIYIFPDGTAIQRQRGYLTDAPTIPEIFQKFPEYSVALNFEDANYYEYAEDEHGDEIYAHIAELATAGQILGGLIWDAIGAVTNGITWSGIQTAQGEYIQITNDLSLQAPLASVEMLGNAEQDGTPTPDAPQPISVVTGENVVKIEGKNLFDGTYINYAIGGTGGNMWFPSSATRSAIISCQPSTTYTVKKYGGNRLNIADAPTMPSDNSTVNVLYSSNSAMEHTITTSATAHYLLVYVSNDSTEPEMQVELGSTATAYEPYQGQEFEVNLGKNLLDPDSISQGTWINAFPTNTCTFFMPIYTGETFTISNQDTATYRFSCGLCATPHAGTNTQDSGWQTGTSYTITAQSNGYLYVQLRKNDTSTITPSTTPTDVYMVERGSQATSFAPYFTPIELAKIGNYQDRIYKTGGKWYIEKKIGKLVLDGTETGWGTYTYGTNSYQVVISGLAQTPNETALAIADRFYGIAYNDRATTAGECLLYSDGGVADRLVVRNTTWTSLADFKTWLSTHPTTVYYALATPTTTEITNEALIAQLDALGASSLYLGVNNIGTETLNAMPTLKIEYYTEYTLDGAGYEWEPGGNTSRTIVTVAGVDSAWPIWTIQGGAQNPTLTNITTGQTISWQGFVPEGQTLTINMAEMTADLAGANVFEYITGEWLRLAPGNNTLVYNAGNADKPSTLSWNGVLA